MRLVTGLCSVTFRSLDPRRVLEVARAAGVDSIEWGGDIHVPAGGQEAAARVAQQSADAGIEVASYGSYFVAGADVPGDLPPALATANALGAPMMRVWAGQLGSLDANARERAIVVTELRDAAEQAATYGMDIGLEYHRGTLTDTTGSTLRLLDEVGAENVTTYWQPPVGASDAEALAGLAAVLDRMSHVHVFSWDDQAGRLPLRARGALWERVVEMVAGTGRRHHLHLEFVAADSPDRFEADAAFLRSLLR